MGVEVTDGGACGGCALTAVNPPPALTAVKPDDIAGRGNSVGGVGAASASMDAFSAADARIAGDSVVPAGVPWADFLMGEAAGEGVNGPPFSYSSI